MPKPERCCAPRKSRSLCRYRRSIIRHGNKEDTDRFLPKRSRAAHTAADAPGINVLNHNSAVRLRQLASACRRMRNAQLLSGMLKPQSLLIQVPVANPQAVSIPAIRITTSSSISVMPRWQLSMFGSEFSFMMTGVNSLRKAIKQHKLALRRAVHCFYATYRR